MLKSGRVFFFILAFCFVTAAVPIWVHSNAKATLYCALRAPLSFSSGVAKAVTHFFGFRNHSKQIQQLTAALTETQFNQRQYQELLHENERLVKLLDLKKILPPPIKKKIFARVIGRSPSSWDRVLLIDKGSRDGMQINMFVLSDLALIGKIIEVGPSASKVLLITDPSSKVGVLIQRTRQEGVLFGGSLGQCRMKYISVDTKVEAGDVVQTAGLGGFFPKGLPIGTIERVWKEPGQIYQVAEVKPLSRLNRIEEVLCAASI